MAGTYLVSLPLGPGMGPRVNKVDSVLVYAGSSTDALTIAKNQFNFNVDALWAAATPLLMAAGADMTGWTARVQLASSTGIVKADVTVGTSSYAAVAAQGSLTLTAHPTAGDTVVVNGITYTFETTLGSTAGNVLFTNGSGGVDAIANLISAINGTAGAGTTYVATTVSPHATVSAAQGSTNLIAVFTAKIPGVLGNAYTLTLSSSAGSVDGSGKMDGTTVGTYGASVDGLGQALVTALNASPQGFIANAGYVVSTHTLTIAGTADSLGDHTAYVSVYPPNGSRDSVVSFVGSLTDAGSAGSAVTVVLVAANTIPSAIIAAQVNPFY